MQLRKLRSIIRASSITRDSQVVSGTRFLAYQYYGENHVKPFVGNLPISQGQIPVLPRNSYTLHHLSRVNPRPISDVYARLMFIPHRSFVREINGDILSPVSLADMKRILRAKFGGFLEGYTCLIIDCPECKEGTLKLSEGKLYVNMRTGYCFCPNCLLSGPWSDFEAYLNAYSLAKEKSAGRSKEPVVYPKLSSFLTPHIPSQIEKATLDELWKLSTAYDKLPIESQNDILTQFGLESITAKYLIKYDCRVATNPVRLMFPIRTRQTGEIIALKLLSVPSSSEQSQAEPITRPVEVTYPRNNASLLGQLQSKEKDEVVLTSSIADLLTIAQHSNHSVLALPLGIEQLPQIALPSLEGYKKIIFWFGEGARGWEAARVFARKLGEKRCFFVRPNDESPSPLYCPSQGLSISTILRNAQPMGHKSITTFSALRDDVLAEVTHSNAVGGVRWRRFPVLNELLKGHRRGELTVFTGPTGAGKTTFISEYSLDLCMQKVNTLWGSFEIRNVRLAKMMLQQFGGFPLEQALDQFERLANNFEKLPLYFLTFHGQQSLKTVLDAMSHAAYVHDIAHVIVDNLQFMMGAGSGDSSSVDRFWKQDQIVGAFRQFATLNNVHVTLVIHPRKEDSEELSTSSIFGSAKASQESDNVLILQDKKLSDPSKRRKYLQVAKNRYTGDLGIMPLEFHKDALSFAPRKKFIKPASALPPRKASFGPDSPNAVEKASFPSPVHHNPNKSSEE